MPKLSTRQYPSKKPFTRDGTEINTSLNRLFCFWCNKNRISTAQGINIINDWFFNGTPLPSGVKK